MEGMGIQHNDKSIFSQVRDELVDEIERTYSSLESDILDLMAVVKEGHGFRSVGGVRD